MKKAKGEGKENPAAGKTVRILVDVIVPLRTGASAASLCVLFDCVLPLVRFVLPLPSPAPSRQGSASSCERCASDLSS